MPTCVVLWLGVPFFLVPFNEGNVEFGAKRVLGHRKKLGIGHKPRDHFRNSQKIKIKKARSGNPGVCLPPEQIKYSPLAHRVGFLFLSLDEASAGKIFGICVSPCSFPAFTFRPAGQE